MALASIAVSSDHRTSLTIFVATGLSSAHNTLVFFHLVVHPKLAEDAGGPAALGENDIGPARFEVVVLWLEHSPDRLMIFVVVAERQLVARIFSLDDRDNVEPRLARMKAPVWFEPLVLHWSAGNRDAFEDDVCLLGQLFQAHRWPYPVSLCHTHTHQ
ncbi:MAG: hypothetical protein GY774_05385 [Planctomycetes bacterium]|nr:hypothetical protein [Planctomycetota bacterium]